MQKSVTTTRLYSENGIKMTGRFTISFILLAISLNIGAQNATVSIETSINGIYERLMNAEDAQKFIKNDSIISIIDDYLHSDTIMESNLIGVRFLGEIIAQDEKLKIVNWNVMDSKGDNYYYCYFIRNHAKENTVYQLKGMHREESIEIDKQYKTNNWYGALYYAIQSFKIKNEEYYMILGYDYAGLGVSRKIIEIISFNDDDEIVFGNAILEKGGSKNMREVLEYSSEGVVSLRFNNKKSVIFDHLASFADNQEASSEYYGSALTFDAYIFEKNRWNFHENVDIRNQ